ncbi:transposable element gene, partial [Prunus dulcis]
MRGKMGNELESLGLENDVFKDTALGKETICRTEASDRSPISDDETCGPCEEMTDRPLDSTSRPYLEMKQVFSVSKRPVTLKQVTSRLYSCMDEFDAIPPSALPVPQSTRDSESSELPPRTARGKPKDDLSNPKWMDAMNVEMDALTKNKTWDLVPLPRGKKAVGCRWVFTLKHKAYGSIDRYKARLVAKGYTQTYGVDYLETFAPVTKLNIVSVLLSLAAKHDWPLLQFDVKNVFLHGDLKEDIYMDLPPSIPVTSKEGVVCKLWKSLYGLKQSPRAWFGRFAAYVKKFGYVQSNSDHTLFLKRHKDKLTTLIIYVDDMIVTGDDQAEMQNLHKYLASEFEMKSLGDLKYFLEVSISKHGIFLFQRKYILDLLAETRMLDCKPIDTSMSVVSQFMHSPSEDHMGAVIRILRYLKVTLGKGLMFCKYGDTDVEGYKDADWAGSVTDRRSTSGTFTFVGGNLVTWRSKKQKVVFRSSAEAEYRGMAPDVLTKAVSNYMIIMDRFVNNASDVDFLVDLGIIENVLGDRKEAAVLFNNLGIGIFGSPDFTFANLCQDLNSKKSGIK